MSMFSINSCFLQFLKFDCRLRSTHMHTIDPKGKINMIFYSYHMFHYVSEFEQLLVITYCESKKILNCLHFDSESFCITTPQIWVLAYRFETIFVICYWMGVYSTQSVIKVLLLHAQDLTVLPSFEFQKFEKIAFLDKCSLPGIY